MSTKRLSSKEFDETTSFVSAVPIKVSTWSILYFCSGLEILNIPREKSYTFAFHLISNLFFLQIEIMKTWLFLYMKELPLCYRINDISKDQRLAVLHLFHTEALCFILYISVCNPIVKKAAEYLKAS
jgi:hypothetical protein